ncbi:t dna binding protein [Diaporthe amygdali]|uniref:t dna binding protein n=1 Tax=Phomopsis amygdali TaxID=1214568 RepID=UPI0022FE017F|nr:t dna binding protein [Diaporthe amygdali]KAJ0109360.1 t dna binding protein [Diaporthe amygdali]
MPPKRKSSQADGVVEDVPRRSTRQRTSTAAAREATASSAGGQGKAKTAKQPATAKKGTSEAKSDEAKVKENEGESGHQPTPAAKKTGKADGVKVKQASAKSTTAKSTAAEAEAKSNGEEASGRQYWLMKAEPESRLENGVDVRFSIDDLAAKSEPEPWDGIRNFVARNNLRAMKKGDLAFFYHSNCKEPGIVGTMEVVREHSPDLTAHDPKCPYYDPKSKPGDPKWSVVHVEFRSKFAAPIGLKELREMGAQGKPLEGMQMLKQSRLSVSRVSAQEWEYLVGVAKERAQDGE